MEVIVPLDVAAEQVWAGLAETIVFTVLMGSLGLLGLALVMVNQRRSSEVALSLRKKAELEREVIHHELTEASRLAGMADMASCILHDVSNVLNSVNVTAAILKEKFRESGSESLANVAERIEQSEGDLADFLSSDPRGVQLLGSLSLLAKHIREERIAMATDLDSLTDHIDHNKRVIRTQQATARLRGEVECIDLSTLVDDVLSMNAMNLERHGIQIVRDFGGLESIQCDKYQLMQILVNRVDNAKDALASTENQRKITIRTAKRDPETVTVSVMDTGAGTAPEELERIFEYGFTTKQKGHGFGLYSSTKAAEELGGSLTVDSAGVNRGATFTLSLPLERPDWPPAGATDGDSHG